MSLNSEPTILSGSDVKLSEPEMQAIVAYINDTWDMGKRGRKKQEDEWKDCIKAYECQQDPIKDPRLSWRSQVYLPWCFDALEAWYAYLHGMILPKDESFFDLSGRQQSDDAGSEAMQKYLRHTFNVNALSEKFGDFLKQLGILGNSAMKVYWRKEEVPMSEWERVQQGGGNSNQVGMDPASQLPEWDFGQGAVIERMVQKNKVVLNCPWLDVIPMAQFVFYPLDGEFDKTCKLHETFKYIEEIDALIETDKTPYFNLDKVKESIENQDQDGTRGRSSTDTEQGDSFYRGVKLRECWIYRVKIEGKVYRNYIATVADEKILIRFQPNPLPLGKTPFVFTSLIPGLNRILGTGLLGKAIGLQKSANFFHNIRMDQVKLDTYSHHKYQDDGVFNPHNFIARPGGLTKVGNLENIMPINKDLSGLQVNMEEVQLLKEEFEEVTVPKIVKGQLDAGDKTATEANLADKGASGKMNTMAQRINEKGLKPLIELTYSLILDRCQWDQTILEDIARITVDPVQKITTDQSGNPLPQPMMVPKQLQQMLSELPKFLPLDEIDVQVVGYQNQMRRQETLIALQQLGTMLVSTPAAKYANWLNLFQYAARMMNVPEDEVFLDKDQISEIDQAEAQAQQQQQQMIQAEAQAQQQQLQGQQQDAQMRAQNEAQRNQIQADNLQHQSGMDRVGMAMDAQNKHDENQAKQMELAIQLLQMLQQQAQAEKQKESETE